MSALKPTPHTTLDRAAIWLSGLCLAHCLAFPLAVLLAPTFADWLGATETTTHWILFGFALPISAVALTRGYRRLGNGPTMLLGSVGLLLMLLAVTHIFGSELEVLLTLIGVIAVLYAHWRNLMGYQASGSDSTHIP